VVKLTFLGTRGYIELQNERHARHSALHVSYHGRGAMVDCGETWLGKLHHLKPRAIIITHAHPDHAFGLKEGAPCPVWATEQAWEKLEEFPIREKRIIPLREPVVIRGIAFEAFAVQHSIRAPAVGYRISAGKTTVFYAPDLVYIHERRAALSGCRLYIGDGSTVENSLVRKQGDQLFGHTPVRTQLTWCAREGVPKMIVTHCGSGIVTGEDKGVRAKIDAYARERNVAVDIAWDGMEVVM
jgi:ribonuclease BN (tRNA processing enzyme)